jgi:hypothetical protein
MRRLSALLTATFFAHMLYAADNLASPRYTFSWPLSVDQLQPRGGTTHGPAVNLDTDEAPAWKALQEKNINDFERDRRAILAMAGTYRVTFDFLEIARFDPKARVQAPYQSWGTEKIYVDADEGNFISLVHILEMRIVQSDGKISEPFVTKHWRQDWRYEPTDIVEYVGNDRWQRRIFSRSKNSNTKRQWSQTVYQVDESPRYASIGHWEHNPAFSSWLSGETRRPLPRREWSVRSDYQLLLGTNRHTITATGWTQEENNLKAVLNSSRELDAQQPFIAREYGIARYERIRDEGFVEADEYFQRTRKFWDEVSAAWSSTFKKYSSITLRGPVDKLGLFQPLFARADQLASSPEASSKDNSETIQSALGAMGVPK